MIEKIVSWTLIVLFVISVIIPVGTITLIIIRWSDINYQQIILGLSLMFMPFFITMFFAYSVKTLLPHIFEY